MTFTNCQTNQNYATNNGGFIYYAATSGCSSEVNLVSSEQTNNEAKNYHGGYTVQLCPNTNTLKINTNN